MDAGSILGFLLVLIIAGLIKVDAEQRGMEADKWATATIFLCLIVVPIYLLVRFPKETKSSYNKKQLIIGNIIFFLGLILLFMLLYYQLFIPYHIGEFDLPDMNLVPLASLVFVYIFGFLALWKKDLGLLALGIYSIILFLIIYLFMLMGHSVYDDDYDVYRKKINISNGYILTGDHTEKDISVYMLASKEYSGIALEGRENVEKDKDTGLYYKNNAIAPFTGVKVNLNSGKSSIKKAVVYDNGRKDRVKKFINEKKRREIKYYHNGQIQSKSLRHDNKLIGEYTEYYSNGQIESKIEPFKGKIDGEFDWESNNGGYQIEIVELNHGKRTYYHENGELRVVLKYKNGQLLPRKYYNDKSELTAEWEDVPLPDNKGFEGEEEKYRIIKGISYKNGKITEIGKKLLYRHSELADYHSQHNLGYSFEYDSDWNNIESRQYTAEKSFGKEGIWLDVRGGSQIERHFYPINGKRMKVQGQKKKGYKIGTWKYYYPDGSVAAIEEYNQTGIIERGEYYWRNKVSILIIANEKGEAKKAVIEFVDRGRVQTRILSDEKEKG